jgi:hypothetical protein
MPSIISRSKNASQLPDKIEEVAKHAEKKKTSMKICYKIDEAAIMNRYNIQ